VIGNQSSSSPELLQQTIESLMAVLAPGLVEEAEKIKNGEYNLVHYTSAENALNILKNKTFWLRNVRCMNDYSEVQHGIELLLKVFNANDDARIKRLTNIFDQIVPGAAKAAIDTFNAWIPSLPDSTYIGCLSVFDPDDQFGRLSMWRAYTQHNAGVAIVMNSDPFIAETNELEAYSLPVAYLSDDQFAVGIDNCLEALEQTVTQMDNLTSDAIEGTLFWWLLSMAVGMKHPAFVEEREWRIIYIPSMGRSPVIEEVVESVGGIPQIVQKIPLRNEPKNGLIKADIPNLVKQIIIGPSEYPLVIRDAFIAALGQNEVELPESKVTNSFIPIR